MSKIERWVALMTGQFILLVGGTCAFVFVATLYILFSQPLYTATVKVAPNVSDASNASLNRTIGQLGGLASLVGASALPNADQNQLEILKSNSAIAAFAREKGILPLVLEDMWDQEKAEWRARKPGLLDRLKFWSDESYRTTLPPEPVDTEISEALQDVLSIRHDEISQVTSVKFTWSFDGNVTEWANGYIEFVNRYIQRKALKESERNLAYLRSQLGQVQPEEVRVSIATLIEEQLKQVMLASNKKEFAFTVLDPASVPHKKSHPKPILIVAIALLLGALFMVLIVHIRDLFSRKFRD